MFSDLRSSWEGSEAAGVRTPVTKPEPFSSLLSGRSGHRGALEAEYETLRYPVPFMHGSLVEQQTFTHKTFVL